MTHSEAAGRVENEPKNIIMIKHINTAVMAVIILALSGCDGKQPGSSPATAPAAAAAPAVMAADRGAVVFSSPAVNDYIKQYTQAVDDYVAAAKARDFSKIGPALQNLSNINSKLDSLEKELKDNEREKFRIWMDSANQRLNPPSQ